jgi:putative transposase
MQRLQAFQNELMPTGDQQRDMVRFAGACRFVFNKALELQKENHAAGNKFIGYFEMANHLPAWKIEFAWLKQSPSQALQHALQEPGSCLHQLLVRNGQGTRVSRSEGTETASVFPKVSNWTNGTAESFCRSWAGCGIGTAGKYLAR